MALNLVPGVGEVTMGLSAAAGAVKSTIGEEQYEKNRYVGTWLYGAAAGFLPTVPVFWPLQIGMVIIFTLVLIFIFNVSVAKSLFTAYIAQALIIMFAAQFMIDKFMRWGVGI